MVSVLGKNVYINANTFKNNKTVVNVDLCDISWVNNSMFNAFYNCNNLTSVTNINQNVTNMSRTFHSCSNLVNAPVIPNSVTGMSSTFEECYKLVNAPVIPNTVTYMDYTFCYCFRLVNAPVIPNSVTDMYSTFCYCIRLVNAPVIPNSVTDMYSTFYSCSNLVNAPVIPNSVTHMVSTFNGCSNLTGNIYIQSENIANASECFFGTSLTKNVFIPFTYDNGVYTKTYNAFIAAGYKTDGSVCGVYLKDLYPTQQYNVTDYNYTLTGKTLTLESYTGSGGDIVVPDGNIRTYNVYIQSNISTPVPAEIMYFSFYDSGLPDMVHDVAGLTGNIPTTPTLLGTVTEGTYDVTGMIDYFNYSSLYNTLVKINGVTCGYREGGNDWMIGPLTYSVNGDMYITIEEEI